MTKKALSLILVIIISIFVYAKVDRGHIVAGSFEECVEMGNPVGESYPRQCWTKDGKHFVEVLPNDSEAEISISGEIACLPKVGNGPQTMECTIGLLSDDGSYYALINMSKVDPDYKFSVGGLKVTVQGMFTSNNKTSPDGNPYNTVGRINVKNITQN